MKRRGRRSPSPWWVLVPGALLALAGVRAVVAEMDRARDDARAAARGTGLAIRTLVDEYSAPLERIRSAADVEEGSRHLYPTWLLRTDGGAYAATSGAETPADEETARRDTGLRDAVRERAEQAIPEVAAALLAATADAVETPAVAAQLRIDAAEADVAAGDAAEALEELRTVLEGPAASLTGEAADPDEPARLGDEAERALRLLLAATEPGHAPEWVIDVARRLQFDEWELGDVRRVELGALVDARFPNPPERGVVIAAEMAARELRDQVRELEWSGRESEACALDQVTDEPGALVVFRRVELESGPAWIAGVVPERAVVGRLAPLEHARRTVVQTSTGPLTGRRLPAPARSDIDESVSVTTLPGWRVDVRLPQPIAGAPPAALALAAAVLLATAALIFGAFALSRAARTQARLAEERRTFLDHVAHEVRTPAAALLALSEELERGHVDTERHPTYHAHLLAEARRLADLVEETLDLSRLEGGRLVAEHEAVDLRDVVRAAVDAARPGDGRVIVTLPDAAVPVVVDRAAMRRSMRNLIDNALKHGDAPQPVEVTLVVRGDDARLTVRDHGPGIPAEHVERVFERFHRVPSATHEVKGVGLGLALVKEVAAMHGGAVCAENAASGGALFTLRLPLANAHEAVHEPERPTGEEKRA